MINRRGRIALFEAPLVRISEAIDHLHRSGLAQHEALILVTLGRLGASTASDLAAASKLNRVQVYRTLEALEVRRFVDVMLGRPKQYLPRPMDEIFDALADERRAELETIETARKAVLRAWPRIARKAELPTLPLQIYKGRAQIYKALRDFIHGAQDEVLAFTTTKGIQRSYRDNINDAVLEAMGRGVKPRLVVDIDEENVALMARVARRVPLRHVDWQRGRFIIFDGVSILVFLVQDERTLGGRAETALWTNSEDYVKAHVEIFEQAWTSGIPAEERIAGLGES